MIQIMNNTIKTIIPTTCPCCKNDILVEFASNAPELTSVFTSNDVQAAKEDARTRVGFLSIDDEKKNQVLEWINDESTLFGPGEVDSIINSLLETE